MRVFSFTKKEPELAITRKVLIEKWEEGGIDVIQSLTNLIRNKIAPALASEMEKSGFKNVVFNFNHNNECWFTENLRHKKLCSGKKHTDWDSLPYEYCTNITSFETYSRWASRAEKMIEKISEIKLQVEEMKTRRNSLSDSIKAVSVTSNKHI